MKVRIVLDANIYASALMNSEGLPAHVLRDIVDHKKYELVLSQDILDELQRILLYPKIRKRIKRTDQKLSAWLDALYLLCHVAIPLHDYPTLVHEDPDDDIYLIAALESRSRYLVTGDQHLLKMKAFENIKIMTARDFFEL